jgi:hypothetical protein
MGDTTVQTGTQPNTKPQGDPAGTQETRPADNNGQGDQLGEAGVKALHEEREARKAEAAARKEEAKARQELQKRLDALKPFEALAQQLGNGDAAKGTSEIEQLGERHAQLEKEIREERDARWRAELAHEHGLTPKQASRLRGSTRDEMDADAKELVADFQIQETAAAGKKPGAPKPDRSQGSGQADRPSGAQQAKEQLAKRFPTKTT